MILAVLIPVAILGVLLLAAVLFFQRGAGGAEATPRTLLRGYLYLGSLVSVLVLTYGLSLSVTGLLGAVAAEFTYGGPPPSVRFESPPEPSATPPPGVPVKPRPPSLEQQNERRTRESLLQGVTSAVAGALFWAVHWFGRRQLEGAEERRSALRRGYFLVGVAIFGVASIILLPMALYQALRYFLIPYDQYDYRQGVGESLAAALVVVPAWLLYLRVVLDDYRAARGAAPPPLERGA